MKKRIVKLLSLVAVVFCFVGITAACGKEPGIVLTEQNQKIADAIYSNIGTWERKSTGATCRYTYLQRFDGKLYFECVYTDNQASTTYRISNGTLIEDDWFADLANSNRYMGGSLLTMSMPDYDISATREEKKTYVENLVREMQDPQKWRELQNK